MIMRGSGVFSMTNTSDNRTIRRVLVSVFLAYFTSYYVMNSLNIALPRMAADLDGMALFSWAIAIPALSGAIITLIFGKLSDMYGRKVILLISVGLILIGSILCLSSPTFGFLILGLSILTMGQGAIQPLCFSILGDTFSPAERGKWAGVLNIASAIAAFTVPTLSGWLVDNLHWRYIFWSNLPLAILAAVVIFLGLSGVEQHKTHQIDYLGSFYLAGATAMLVVAFSWAGNSYAWLSLPIVGLFSISAVFFVLFLRTERIAPEPMLDPAVLTNRTFIIASLAALLSLIGVTSIMVYYPLFLQGVQTLSATLSGKILTPFSVLLSVMGIPAGLMIAKTKRYRWMYVLGYAGLTAALFILVSFHKDTPVGLGLLVTILAGIGLGAIPTINALVVQYAVPKRLIGTATGGLYFFVLMGRAIAPAILGSRMNAVYNRDLAGLLPANLAQFIGQTSVDSFSDPRVLLSQQVMKDLKDLFISTGSQGMELFGQTIQAIRSALENGIQSIFWIGATTMLISFLLIIFIPEISLDDVKQD
jgi:MFS family permease